MKIITLCGSTKFKNEFRKVEAILALEGNIVLSLNFFEQSDNILLTKEQFSVLEKVHQRKLEMCDEVFVIDVNNYIGESTKNEIIFAQENNKPIRYYTKEQLTFNVLTGGQNAK